MILKSKNFIHFNVDSIELCGMKLYARVGECEEIIAEYDTEVEVCKAFDKIYKAAKWGKKVVEI